MTGWIFAYSPIATPWTLFKQFKAEPSGQGIVYAIAHVRSGQEMGTGLYFDGKMMNKIKFLQDFIKYFWWLNQMANLNCLSARFG